MTTETEFSAAPAEVTFQVTVRRAAPGVSGAFSLVTSGLLASDQAIEFIETHRDAALADGVAVAATDAAPDPTADSGAQSTAGTDSPQPGTNTSAADAGEPL